MAEAPRAIWFTFASDKVHCRRWGTTPGELPDEQKYLRADTCTPNEECVSKAELEKFDGWLDNLLDSDDDGSQEDTLWLDGYDAGIRDAQRKLREVMDK